VLSEFQATPMIDVARAPTEPSETGGGAFATAFTVALASGAEAAATGATQRAQAHTRAGSPNVLSSRNLIDLLPLGFAGFQGGKKALDRLFTSINRTRGGLVNQAEDLDESSSSARVLPVPLQDRSNRFVNLNLFIIHQLGLNF
jgi:hypothetical protein